MNMSKPRGFSLLEVLVAVVVLSFGLLALAMLQSSLLKASAEAKAQTVGISLAKAKLEQLRSFRDIASYQSITSSASSDTITDSAGDLGGVSFTRSWVVDRYAMPKAGGAFDNSVAVTGALNSATYAENNEFKTVRVNVSWVDANGQSKTLVLEDAIAAIDPQDSARTRIRRGLTPRGPKVNIFLPSLEDGVIPIAIGDSGSETAATNPRPEVMGRNNTEAVVETRFDVLTYAEITGTNTALGQSRVETAVVGCKCSTANAPASSTKAYRPTYWNGFRYVAPEVANYAPPAGAASIANNEAPQSPFCVKCCQNHHDPATLASTAPKFDPWRATHAHSTSAQGEYLEACRVIRVDGIFDVAVDMSNDYFNLLETASNATSPKPSDAGTANYQTFVIDYLQARYVNGTASGYNNRTTPAPASFATTLEVPASLPLARTNDTKWLHARGLYLDYLEKDARDAVDDARSQCQDQTTIGKLTCVLRVLPFTSINLTELAHWISSSAAQLDVTNDGFIDALTEDKPIRGKVTPGSLPTIGATPLATAEIKPSNSGVALFPAVDTDDASAKSDQQQFEIGGSSNPPGDGGTFEIQLLQISSILGGGRVPNIAFDAGSQSSVTCDPAAVGSADYPNNYNCTAQSLSSGATVRVGGYNFQGTTSFSGQATCTKNNGSDPQIKSIPLRNDRPVCRNFRLSSVTGGGVLGGVTNSGRLGETTAVSYGSLSDGALLEFTFTDETAALPSTLDPSEYQCTYNGPNVSLTWIGCDSR